MRSHQRRCGKGPSGRSIHASGILALITVGIVLSWAMPAGADAHRRVPEVAFTLEDLSPNQRELLHRVASLDESQVDSCSAEPDACTALVSAFPDWRNDLTFAVRKLAALRGWRAAALLLLVDPRLVDVIDQGTAGSIIRACGRPQPTIAEKRPDRCATVCNMNPEEVKLWSWAKLEGSRCEVNDQVTRENAILSVVAEPKDRVGVVVSAAKRPQILWLDEAQSWKANDQLRYLALVPKYSWVTVRIERDNWDLPIIVSYYANLDAHLVEVVPPQPNCLELDFRPEHDPSLHVFMDGQPLGDTRFLEISEDRSDGKYPDHQLTILRTEGHRHRLVTSRNIPGPAIRDADGCYRVQLDLTKRERNTDLAIVNASAKGCGELGIDSTEVRHWTEQFLRHAGIQPKDIQRWADTLSGFQNLLRPLTEGREIGAPTGRDSRQVLSSSAADLVRQGFHSLLSVELVCHAGVRGTQHRFSVASHILDLDNLDGPVDTVAGIELGGALRSEQESVVGEPQLDSALVASLSRLMGRPYVRFEPRESQRVFDRSVAESVRMYVPAAAAPDTPDTATGTQVAPPANSSYQITLEAKRADAATNAACPSSGGNVPLVVQSTLDDWWKNRSNFHTWRAKTTFAAETSTEVHRSVAWDPAQPGRYVLRLQLAGPAATDRAIAYRCVDVVANAPFVWADLGYSRTFGPTPARNARRDTMAYGQFMTGLTPTETASGGLVLGVVLGYGNAIHTRTFPPSWELPIDGESAPTFGFGGQLGLSWTRQSFLVGPTFSYRLPAPICHLIPDYCPTILRSLDIVVRAMPLFDIGKFTTSGVDPNLRRFLSGASGLDLDLSTFIQAGVLWHVAQNASVYGMTNLAWLGWDDWVLGGRDQTEAQSLIDYDSMMVFGGTFGVAWER